MKIKLKIKAALFLGIFLLSLQNYANSSNIKKNDEIDADFIITNIRADIIDVRRKVEQITFSKNVVIEREDTSLLADEMIVYYREDKMNQNNNQNDQINQVKIEKGDYLTDLNLQQKTSDQESTIKEIRAKGNVKIFNDEFVAIGETGFYDPNSGEVLIEKNVIFNSGSSRAKGEKFVYNVNSKKGYLVGNVGENYDNEKSIKKKNKNYKKDERVIIIVNPKEIKEMKQEKNKENKENKEKNE